MSLTTKLFASSVLLVLISLVWHWYTYVNIEEFYNGKRIILTGASRGIGKSLAIRLSQLGTKLVLAARSENDLKETQALCLQNTPQVEIVVANVSQEEDCRQIVDKAVDHFGGVDVLILNAAYSPTPTWFADLESPGKKFADVFSVNVLQSVYLVKFALPHLKKSQGIIVPVSSLSSLGPVPKVTAYATSKHALNGFFNVLHQEFVMTNTPVSISIMMVPYVRTQVAVDNWKPIGSDGITPEDCADDMARAIPLKRLWYYMDWRGSILGRFYHLNPSFFDAYIRNHISQTSYLFS